MQDPQMQMDNPTALLAMLNMSGKSPHVWLPQELAAILRHELQAPLALALGAYAAEADNMIRQLSDTNPPPESLESVLLQPRPSVEILNVVKKFAKSSSLEGVEDGMPREIALLLYFLSIALARARCQTRLSELPDEAVMNGLQWMLGQNWVADSIRSLASEALNHLGQSKIPTEQ
jgi:hypothetical protein